MRHLNIKSTIIALAIIAIAQTGFTLDNMVPNKPQKDTMNSWCTWCVQDHVLRKYKKAFAKGEELPEYAKDLSKISQRDGINEDTIFGKEGWANQWDAVRGDMYFILDDGWDVEYGEAPSRNISVFGSLILNDTRFPSVKGMQPKDKLKWINDKLKEKGWKGAALWIASQMQGESNSKRASKEEQMKYWKERIEWSKYARIEYWKVDWGVYCHNVEFRRMLTKLAEEIYPDLIIENAYPAGAANFVNDIVFKAGKYSGSGIFANTSKKDMDRLCKILSFSKLFRTYDSIGTAISLDRIAFELELGYKEDWNFYLTCEDNPLMGAALASYCGEMINYDDVRARNTVCFLRWQRLAPAQAANELKTKYTSERLVDTFSDKDNGFKESKGCKAYPQSAPAIIVRGEMDFPKISVEEGKLQPFVAATLHNNGTLSISFMPRKGAEITPVDGYFNVNCDNRKIGVFGKFKSISFNTAKASNLKVFIQDLASDTPVEIKDFSIKDKKLVIDFDKLPFDKVQKETPAFIIFAQTK